MGELYMDNIDRALAREHKSYHDGCSLEKEAKTVDSLRRRQILLEHIVRTSAPGDMDARPEALPSGTR